MKGISSHLLCGILLTAIACTQEEIVVPDGPSDCKAVPATDYNNTYSLTRSWRLLWIETPSTNDRTYPPCPRVRDEEKYLVLDFDSDSNRCGGFAVMNRFGGEYKLDDANGLSVSKIIQTLVGGSDEMVEFETRYLQALLQVTSFEIDHNFLILTYGKSGNDVLFFVSQSD